MIFYVILTLVFTIIGGITGGALGASEACITTCTFNVVFGSIMGSFAGGLVGALLTMPVAGFTGGSGRNYGNATVIGTVVSVSFEGIIFKTHEAKIQQGVGEHASFLRVSGYDMSKFLGKSVSLDLNIYWQPDYRRGETNTYVSKIPIVNYT
jgi:hypothetical protein